MARFLIDASLPRATADAVRSLGHEATDVRDIGLGASTDVVIAEYARQNDLSLMTRDHDFGNVQEYPPERYHGIIVLHCHDRASRSAVLAMVEHVIRRPDIVEALSGRLAVVDPQRIRLRPPL